jgi:hypothetical protein
MRYLVELQMVLNFENKIFNNENLYLGIFTQGIGRVSDKNPTEFTPAGRFKNNIKNSFISIFSKVGHLVSGVLSIFGKQHG